MISNAARFGGRLAVIALLAGMAGAGAQAQLQLNPSFGGRDRFLSSADPSSIVAAEIAFAQLARKEGQWTGFRKTSDADAVMFVPGVVNAQSWLRKQKDPAQSVVWAPERIFVSCDASYAVSLGRAAWPDGRKSRFVTLWRRQANGSYKWMLDWGSNAPAPEGVDEAMVDGKVADCPARQAQGVSPPVTGETPAQSEQREWREGAGRHKRPKPPKYEVARIADPPPAIGEGQSRDGTLHWQWTTAAQGARTLKVTVRYGGKLETVVDDSYAAAGS